jgi:hypothetical protein
MRASPMQRAILLEIDRLQSCIRERSEQANSWPRKVAECSRNVYLAPHLAILYDIDNKKFHVTGDFFTSSACDQKDGMTSPNIRVFTLHHVIHYGNLG